jgi:ParB-like chromosome segregation protein Spo0J
MAAIISLGRLAIMYVALSVLILDPKNPRQHSARQIRQIARSIEAFGHVVPILVDCRNMIVAGHGRYLAAQSLGMEVVPVIRLEHLTDAQVKAFRIADNRLTDMSSWDDQLLAKTLKELSGLELDFSIEATGFTMGEIDLRIEGLSAIGDDKSDSADQLPTLTAQLAVSKAGDLWRLGRHALLCGTALSEDGFRALLRAKRAHMVFTDPPYNIPIQGNTSGHGNIQYREFPMGVGELDVIEFTSLLTRCCALVAKHSVDGAMHFICMDWRHSGELLEAGRLAYDELKNVCVWVKGSGGLGSLYRSEHELVFVFKHGSAPHRNNLQLGKYGRNRTNVWHYPRVASFGRQSEEGHLAALHPTIKPVAMVADAILDCSARGDIVLDPFLGSGTTLIAAERVGRRCYGMEIDPLYIDTIIRRWQAFTGDKATHAVTGKTFDDIAGEVEARHD